jgi:hypothetical protein
MQTVEPYSLTHNQPTHRVALRYQGGGKKRQTCGMKYWEIIADNLSKAGRSWGCVSAVDFNGQTIWIADAHRDDGKLFIVRADEKLSAFAFRRFPCRLLWLPKRIGLRSNIQLSGALVNSSSITSSDGFNLSSARLNKPQGLDLR